jgi:hypothetical protein
MALASFLIAGACVRREVVVYPIDVGAVLDKPVDDDAAVRGIVQDLQCESSEELQVLEKRKADVLSSRGCHARGWQVLGVKKSHEEFRQMMSCGHKRAERDLKREGRGRNRDYEMTGNG